MSTLVSTEELGFIEACHLSDKDITLLSDIYCGAFPAEQTRPGLFGGSSPFKNKPQIIAVTADSTPVAILTWWHLGASVHIEHFAVAPANRQQGLGSRILKQFVNKIANYLSVSVEVEPPDSDKLAARRIKFYQRLGFEVIDTTYIQPPYTEQTGSVPLWLMSTGKQDTDAKQLGQMLHQTVYALKN